MTPINVCLKRHSLYINAFWNLECFNGKAVLMGNTTNKEKVIVLKVHQIKILIKILNELALLWVGKRIILDAFRCEDTLTFRRIFGSWSLISCAITSLSCHFSSDEALEQTFIISSEILLKYSAMIGFRHFMRYTCYFFNHFTVRHFFACYVQTLCIEFGRDRCFYNNTNLIYW